ncbi:putative transcriptional regulator, CopG family [candidate division TM7 genomosp. GTL1]|nr:putative transcriptional regulator, CopG family [candidate division TM7 genomosp. GTL1]
MSTQTINISLPKELIKEIDSAAKAEYASRSDYIRQALVGKLKSDKAQSDDWDLLEALSVEIAENAKKEGYRTDEEFVRATKEIRHSKLTKVTK